MVQVDKINCIWYYKIRIHNGDCMYKCVIFDLDGTLLDTLEDLADAGNYALRQLGYPQHEIEKYKYFVGNGIPKLIERILPENSDSVVHSKARDLFSEYYTAHSMDKTRPYPGVSDLLAELKANGIKAGVASNKDHDFSEVLVRNYFGDMIQAVCGRKDGSPKKPDPFSVNYIIESLKVNKYESLYVGDSNVDMETAANAGLTSCGVLWGFRTEKELRESGAQFIVNDPVELYGIIDK